MTLNRGTIRQVFVSVLLTLTLSIPAGCDEIRGQDFRRAEPPHASLLGVKTSGLFGLFRQHEEKFVRFSVRDVPSTIDQLQVNLSAKDAFGKPEQILPEQVVLTRARGFVSEGIPVRAGLGYYDVSYTIAPVPKSEVPWRPGKFGLGVIPNNSVKTKDPASPFGVNTHFNQGWDFNIAQIVARAGIPWIRDGEAGPQDRAFHAAQANHLCYLPCFTFYRKPLAQNRDADGTWDFRDVAEKYRQAALSYGSAVEYFDLVNEPNDPWSSVLGGAWIPTFVKFGTQASEALRSANPKAKVLWEDGERLLWYRQFQQAGVDPTLIAVISPHTFNYHPEVPLPEDQPILKQFSGYRAFTTRHKLDWPVWVSEVGVSSCTAPNGGDYHGPNTELEQASKLVRTMVLQNAAGVRKLFWYDFKNDGTDPANPEHNFGLIRADLSPKPSLIAYAYLIYHVQRGQWVGTYPSPKATYAYVFESAAGKAVMVTWRRTGTGLLTLSLKSRLHSVDVSDLFGHRSSVALKRVEKGRAVARIVISNNPVYIEGLRLSDIVP